MSSWEGYSAAYRSQEIQAILSAVQAGECVSIVGLSGSGKSNLLGFLANQQEQLKDPHKKTPAFFLVDCNRLGEITPQAFYRLVGNTLQKMETPTSGGEFAALEAVLVERMSHTPAVCLLFDRFDALLHSLVEEKVRMAVTANLRALRDAHKYNLTYVVATRKPLDPHNELAELFFAHTLWLGPLAESEARWNIARYAGRKGLAWDESVVQALLDVSRGYPSLLRAVCEAYDSGSGLDICSLAEHPAVRRRADELWADQPSAEEISFSGLLNHPLLDAARISPVVDTTQLTAKEHLLWAYLLAHPGQVCEKDDLIRAVWPEDRIFERGVRDDSLAQLVRRLREKIEPNPSTPLHIHTIPGRGYRFAP
jgi:DNA-binding winged helix-turn-helix (wHTH) protein/energy-coupling factor transporter ATP-binding protein EcfA2